MKRIKVSVEEVRYGSFELEVPEGSVILDKGAAYGVRKRSANRLARKALADGNVKIKWSPETELVAGGFYITLDEDDG